jgi:dolichol-phosphate mannosyltransferase
MTAPPRTLVAIATYNEAENLPRLVDQVFLRVPQATVLVVDDNSPDGTGRWCDDRALRDERFLVRHRPAKLGLGTAVLEAMRLAQEQDFELLVTMDADFSHDPSSIPDLIAGLQAAGGQPIDVMIGSRYVQHGRIEGWPWQRRWMSRFVNFYARYWLRLTPRDCSGGFRCYRVAILRQVDLGRMRSRGYSFLEELLWRLQRAGARVGETPIVFVNRRHGRSKIDIREAWSALWILFGLRWSPP